MNRLPTVSPIAARILVSLVFLLNGLGIVDQSEALRELIARGAPVAIAPTLLWIARSVEVAGGVSLAVGVYPELAALALIGFLIPATWVGHPFWLETGTANYTPQLINFFKNMAVIGGLLFFASAGNQASRRGRCQANPVSRTTGDGPIVGLNQGLIHLNSPHSVTQTMNALEAVVRSRSLTVAARIDHSGDAAKAGLRLKPTELLIFGNPKAGTPLMVASPPVAIDLPLKALAWQDADGRVWLSYNSPEYLKQRYDIPEGLLGNIAGIASLCEEAVR